jgi:hypothetical protein
LADLRPIWAKYAESFLSITAASHHSQPMSINSAPTAASPGCSSTSHQKYAHHKIRKSPSSLPSSQPLFPTAQWCLLDANAHLP